LRGEAVCVDRRKQGGEMTTDVIGSFFVINEYLKGRGVEVVPDGIYLKIMSRGKAVAVLDTIEEVAAWIKKNYGVELLQEVEE
jgi:hypothetical protein